MERKKESPFDQAVLTLSPRLRQMLLALPDQAKEKIQEIRLRTGGPIVLTEPAGCCFLTETGRLTYMAAPAMAGVSKLELTDTFKRMCGYSVHSCQASIAQGYLTLPGGHRAGLCGTAVMENGVLTGMRDLTSINLRIARECAGAADALLQTIFKTGQARGFILAGPPTSGKTTLLRDAARQLSSGRGFRKVAVVDERREIAAVSDGALCHDLGYNCDVLSGYPKGEGISIAVRTLSPDWIFCDELGSMEEIEAVRAGLNSGVCFGVSIHAADQTDLKKRPQLLALLETRCFDYVILLQGGEAPGQIEAVYQTEDLLYEIYRDLSVDHRYDGDRTTLQPVSFQKNPASGRNPDPDRRAAYGAYIPAYTAE